MTFGRSQYSELDNLDHFFDDDFIVDGIYYNLDASDENFHPRLMFQWLQDFCETLSVGANCFCFESRNYRKGATWSKIMGHELRPTPHWIPIGIVDHMDMGDGTCALCERDKEERTGEDIGTDWRVA